MIDNYLKNRNIAFKVRNKIEFKYLQNIFKNEKTFYFNDWSWSTFGDNSEIWIYRRFLESDYIDYGYDHINSKKYLYGNVLNPIERYKDMNYIIINISNLMRTEKLKRLYK